MSNYYQIKCTHCSFENDITAKACSSCGSDIPGTINVRRASVPAEVEALELRYNEAKASLLTAGLENEGDYLADTVKSIGKAVINTQFNFLWEWLVRNTFSYQSYRRQLINGARIKAAFEHDVNRTFADTALFGSEIDIIYAALSINESGVMSYGDITVLLKTPSIEKRTSALERNSFPFIDDVMKKGWVFRKPLPAGYMCIWATNHKLAVAKLHTFLKKALNLDDLSGLILRSTGDRATDEFIELYIYGKIAASVIEKIRIPSSITGTFNAKDKLRLKELKSKFNVEEYSG